VRTQTFVFARTMDRESTDRCFVYACYGNPKMRCDYLVIATHNPLMGQKGVVTATLFQSKLSLYTSYVLGARAERDSAGSTVLGYK
jgi:hypothetical protein